LICDSKSASALPSDGAAVALLPINPATATEAAKIRLRFMSIA
jgi:hypothetical protein